MNARFSEPKDFSTTLRALSHLLRYPDEAQRARLDGVAAALRADGALNPTRRNEIEILIASMHYADPFDVEALYLEFFERGRSTSLHLFEHVHGDSRERGQAMVDLIKTYEAAGLTLADGELPDFLPVALEYASVLPPLQARAFLEEIAHILNALYSALQRRGSDYTCAIAALLELAGETPRPQPVAPDPALDEAWEAPAAFGGCTPQGQQRPDLPQPVHLVRRATTARTGVEK